MPESVDRPSEPGHSAPQTSVPDHSAPDHSVEAPLSISDLLGDLTRAVTRQHASIDQLVRQFATADARGRAAADIPLLVELLAIRGDAATCARTAESDRESAAFTAVSDAVERLIVGRGGTVVSPATGAEFSASTMEAAEIIRTDDPALDRTVDKVVLDGLQLVESGRSVRPALVVVRRYRGSPDEQSTQEKE